MGSVCSPTSPPSLVAAIYEGIVENAEVLSNGSRAIEADRDAVTGKGRIT